MSKKIDAEWGWRNSGLNYKSAKECKDALFNIVQFLLEKKPDGFEEFIFNNHGVHELVAMNPLSPPDVLRALFESRGDELWYCLGSNPSLPVDVLVELGEQSVAAGRPRGFANPNMPVSMLEEHFVKLGGQIAENPNASPEMLWRVVREVDDTQVNIHVAQNPNLPLDLAEHLYAIGYSNINGGLASNPNLPRTVLDKLLEKHSYYEDIVENTPHEDVLVDALLNPPYNPKTEKLLSNPHLSREILIRILPDVHWKHIPGLMAKFGQDKEVVEILWELVKDTPQRTAERQMILDHLLLLPEYENLPSEWVESAL